MISSQMERKIVSPVNKIFSYIFFNLDDDIEDLATGNGNETLITARLLCKTSWNLILVLFLFLTPIFYFVWRKDLTGVYCFNWCYNKYNNPKLTHDTDKELNLFDLKRDFYYFGTNRLSFMQTIIFSFKTFWNIFVIALLVSSPIILIQAIIEFG